jgi:preprotein translocase subunit SecY
LQQVFLLVLKIQLTFFNNGELSGLNLELLPPLCCCFLDYYFTEKAFRKVPVQYAKRVVNNRVFGGQTSHLPIKVNISGVMPPIFASALLGFPATVAQFVPQGSVLGTYVEDIQASLAPGNTLYNVVFVGLIIFFAFFYAQIQFKTEDISESLRKNGGFIPGIRPGQKTAEFLDQLLPDLLCGWNLCFFNLYYAYNSFKCS